jgi:hypothetical protein
MHMTSQMQRAFTAVRILQELMAEKVDIQQRLNLFPRSMEIVVLYGLEIPIIKIHNLTLHAATEYLCILYDENSYRRNIVDRPLYGLLHVGTPSNLIFIEKNLPAHISNYILSHELGHFLADIFSVQRLWLKTLPEQREAILRAFMWQELDAQLELSILIKGLPPRPHAIVRRDSARTTDTIEREIQADLIAREILAPWDVVAPLFEVTGRRELLTILYQRFGLPRRIAWYYVRDLQRCLAPGPDMLDRLFAPVLPLTED